MPKLGTTPKAALPLSTAKGPIFFLVCRQLFSAAGYLATVAPANGGELPILFIGFRYAVRILDVGHWEGRGWSGKSQSSFSPCRAAASDETQLI